MYAYINMVICMHSFKVDDIVLYNKDRSDLFSIIEINDKCLLQGIKYRIIIEVDIKDIELASEDIIDKIILEDEVYKRKIIGRESRDENKYLLGKILHSDGDCKYLDKCLKFYEEVGVYVYGVKISESNIYKEIKKYIDIVNPDIIVITGHDYYNNKNIKDLDNYKNTENFIKAVKEIRKENQTCCVIAGACQSNFEALIASGADFASSPGRKNIHVYDPAIIAIKVATTSFRQIVDMNNIYKYIENGRKAFGGLQTNGKMRLIV